MPFIIFIITGGTPSSVFPFIYSSFSIAAFSHNRHTFLSTALKKEPLTQLHFSIRVSIYPCDKFFLWNDTLSTQYQSRYCSISYQFIGIASADSQQISNLLNGINKFFHCFHLAYDISNKYFGLSFCYS